MFSLAGIWVVLSWLDPPDRGKYEVYKKGNSLACYHTSGNGYNYFLKMIENSNIRSLGTSQ